MTVLEARGGKIRIGVDAPKDVAILRSEAKRKVQGPKK